MRQPRPAPVFSKWTTAAALAAGLNATAAGSAAFWQRIDNTTLTQTNLTLARSFRNPTQARRPPSHPATRSVLCGGGGAG